MCYMNVIDLNVIQVLVSISSISNYETYKVVDTTWLEAILPLSHHEQRYVRLLSIRPRRKHT